MLKVGTTTGLYYVARAEELADVVKKIGYGLTRGANVIEISGDVPHEVDYTQGKEVRHIAKKQGIDLLFHGSLTVPMCIPERTDWRDANDHMQKSIRSAVNAGCKYVLFHSCLHFWVEMLTYVGTKLEITMCDHIGRFISEILYDSEKLREWFIKHIWDLGEGRYPGQILDEEQRTEAINKAHAEMRTWERRETERISREAQIKAGEILEMEKAGKITHKEAVRKIAEIEKRAREKEEAVSKRAGVEESSRMRRYMEDRIREKMKDPDKLVRDWNVKTYGKLSDGYKLMAHYLFYKKDPIWVEMVKMYRDVVEGKYKLDYSDDWWLDKAWERAERENDRKFKEFYYGVVAAKFLEGHVQKILEWMYKDPNGLVKKELANKPDLIPIAKNLKITFEIPDARDPKYAGLYLLWHPKQLYAAIKTIRKTLKTDRVFITEDFEHMATQGIDPLEEIRKLVKIAPDLGKYILSVHSNTPNPLHSHYPIELGDEVLYELLFLLKKTGMGKYHTVYLLFERGGGENPFRQAVDALKLMVKFLEKEVPLDQLPLEFYGLERTAGDERRQLQIMMDHRFEPLKDLLETPEEEWTFLSQAAVKKGKQKEFKKEEVR
jgi:sugar phosphate isomerase/epimerase